VEDLELFAEALATVEPLADQEDQAGAEKPPAPDPEARRATPVRADFLSQGGYFCVVSVYGSSAKVRLPREVEQVDVPDIAAYWAEARVQGEEVRDRVSGRSLYLLPHDDYKALHNLGERLRRLPERFGLVVLGVDPHSSGRWIPVAGWPAFREEYQEACQALKAFLEQLDGRWDELQRRWLATVRIVSRAWQLPEGIRDRLLLSFPRSFGELVRPRMHVYRIANVADVELAAAREAKATAERVAAEAELQATRIQGQERLRLAEETLRRAQDDLDRMVLQIKSIVFQDLRKVMEGLEKGGKATGPAVRRLRGIFEEFQRINIGGAGELEARLAALESLTQGYTGEGSAQALLAATRELADSIRGDHEAWERLVEEYAL
jgi:hypothetical protein